MGYEVVLRGPARIGELLVEGLARVRGAQDVVDEHLVGVARRGRHVIEATILGADRG